MLYVCVVALFVVLPCVCLRLSVFDCVNLFVCVRACLFLLCVFDIVLALVLCVIFRFVC